jgi:hypothetical protein
MNTKLTFKQYLESKEKLREAVTNVPRQTTKYRVNKYCQVVVGESKESKQYVKLKPNHTIVVEWIYDNMDNPTIDGVKFDNVEEIDPQDVFDMYWDGKKFQTWLFRNTREHK